MSVMQRWPVCAFAVALVAAIAMLAGCRKGTPPARGEDSAAEVSRVHRDSHGDVRIRLDAETQKRLGLERVTLKAASFAPEIKAVGRVLDPASIFDLVGDYVSARTSAELSARELERAQTLVKSDNISARAQQAAEAAAARDAVQVEVARAKLFGALGNELGGSEDLPDFARSLVSGAGALVRLELPPAEKLPNTVRAARLLSLGESGNGVAAKFAGTTTVDPRSQTRGALFLVEARTSGLTAGEAVTGFIKVSGEAQSGVLVPHAAVLRKDGTAWCYLQTGETEFARREVRTDRPAEGGWFVTRGVSAGDQVVTVGAQIILSEELNAASLSDGDHP